VLGTPDVIRLQQLAESVHVEEDILDYVLGLATFTRKHRRVYLGASPRAALALLYASKARALLKGRDFVLPDDVKWLAPYVLAHRVLMTPEAELEGARADAVVTEAVAQVPYRRRR
jgi:MoxR-like ATPase